MKRYGPDSLNSWIISFSCCFINMMMFGMARLSGILFVASIPWFNVSREKASFPYTFANFMRNTSGPLVGFLGHRFGVRPVATFGCLLGAFGAGTCFFAESVGTVTVLWGAVFGLGFGLGNILLPVSINQHFDRHRATASGISFSGACLGSFVLPPIVEILLKNYGLSGTFLFLSGFILNCVPAALLLRKPNNEIKSKPYECDRSERQSIVPSMKVKLYTLENDNLRPRSISKVNSVIAKVPRDKEKDTGDYSLVLTYDEKIKRLSTQTLLSDYSIRMSVSEPLDIEQIIENSKGRRTVNPKVHEAETLSLTSDRDVLSEDEDVFEKNVRSQSFKHQKPAVSVIKSRSLSSENIVDFEGKRNYHENDAYLNFGYQPDMEDIRCRNVLDVHTNITTINIIPENMGAQSHQSVESHLKSSYQRNIGRSKLLPDEFENISNTSSDFKNSLELSNNDNFKTKPEVLSYLTEKDVSIKQSSCSFSVIFDPMFILIAITNAIYCFTFVCVITVIVDFARDHQIETSKEMYILMSLSIGDFIGKIGLGWITDRGHMTTTRFAALCFACQGITTVTLVWSNSFLTFIIIVTLFGLSEAALIVIYPIIIAQYIDRDKQTVAIPSSNFLSGPLCLAVSPMIGYFRDEIGAYDYVFYALGILSAACCLCFLLAPYVAKCQARSRCETT